MAWTIPRTWVAGEVVTAKELNDVCRAIRELQESTEVTGSGTGVAASLAAAASAAVELKKPMARRSMLMLETVRKLRLRRG